MEQSQFSFFSRDDVSSISCVECRKCHRKCNRTKPLCGRCERMHLTCHYRSRDIQKDDEEMLDADVEVKANVSMKRKRSLPYKVSPSVFNSVSISFSSSSSSSSSLPSSFTSPSPSSSSSSSSSPSLSSSLFTSLSSSVPPPAPSLSPLSPSSSNILQSAFISFHEHSFQKKSLKGRSLSKSSEFPVHSKFNGDAPKVSVQHMCHSIVPMPTPVTPTLQLKDASGTPLNSEGKVKSFLELPLSSALRSESEGKEERRRHEMTAHNARDAFSQWNTDVGHTHNSTSTLYLGNTHNLTNPHLGGNTHNLTNPHFLDIDPLVTRTLSGDSFYFPSFSSALLSSASSSPFLPLLPSLSSVTAFTSDGRNAISSSSLFPSSMSLSFAERLECTSDELARLTAEFNRMLQAKEVHMCSALEMQMFYDLKWLSDISVTYHGSLDEEPPHDEPARCVDENRHPAFFLSNLFALSDGVLRMQPPRLQRVNSSLYSLWEGKCRFINILHPISQRAVIQRLCAHAILTSNTEAVLSIKFSDSSEKWIECGLHLRFLYGTDRFVKAVVCALLSHTKALHSHSQSYNIF